jgi:hypothetical protein
LAEWVLVKKDAMKRRLASESIPEDCIYNYVDIVTNGIEGDDADLVITN